MIDQYKELFAFPKILLEILINKINNISDE
jgi:hypothetical protein